MRLRSKLDFKFRHELELELFFKVTQISDLICELKLSSDLLNNSALEAKSYEEMSDKKIAQWHFFSYSFCF